jgi:aerobic-type carbon monoxide dehydrogenase small subunit (CoxS/CutS family)
MAKEVGLTINGVKVRVLEGATVAAAIIQAGFVGFRKSVSGEMRAPLCGMGICFECRVMIDGQAHARSCQIVCRDKMQVQTDE